MKDELRERFNQIRNEIYAVFRLKISWLAVLTSWCSHRFLEKRL